MSVVVLLLAGGTFDPAVPGPVVPQAVRELVATGLDWPVSLAFSPDGRILYNERFTGRIRALEGGGPAPASLAAVSVVTNGEQGLLGLALDPDFSEEPWAYVYHTYLNETEGRVWNRVVRFRLESVGPPLLQVVLDRIPAGIVHNGGILGFAPDGTLFITTGDAADRSNAEDVTSLAGKILRLNREGTVPTDNPVPGSPVYSMGHRNVFGLAFHPRTGEAYVSENGPTGNDEVNLIEAGRNYGWPDGTGAAGDTRFVDPILTFPETIAPTGIAFLGDALFLGDWVRRSLRRIDLAPPEFREVLGTEVLFDFPKGILDVELGPDGALYVSIPDSIYRVRFETGGGPPVELLFAMAAGAAVLLSALGWKVFRRRRRA